MRAQVINMFVVQLMDQGHHALVPLYACHLRPTLLEPTYTAFLEMLNGAPLPQKDLVLRQALQSLPVEGARAARRTYVHRVIKLLTFGHQPVQTSIVLFRLGALGVALNPEPKP